MNKLFCIFTLFCVCYNDFSYTMDTRLINNHQSDRILTSIIPNRIFTPLVLDNFDMLQTYSDFPNVQTIILEPYWLPYIRHHNIKFPNLTHLIASWWDFRDLTTSKEFNTFLKDNPTLIGLDLHNHDLSFFPNIICVLKDLTVLKISTCQINDIPNAISKLTNLEILDLADNRLKTIPKSICKLPKLKKLYLSHNLLSSIPKQICHLKKLQELDLGYNLIQEIPKEISQLQHLEHFYFHKNNIKFLHKKLWYIPSLQLIWLDQNLHSLIPNYIEIEKSTEDLIHLIMLGKNKVPLSNEQLYKILDQIFVHRGAYISKYYYFDSIMLIQFHNDISSSVSLHDSIRLGRLGSISWLIEQRHADYTIRDSLGRTPLMLSQQILNIFTKIKDPTGIIQYQSIYNYLKKCETISLLSKSIGQGDILKTKEFINHDIEDKTLAIALLFSVYKYKHAKQHQKDTFKDITEYVFNQILNRSTLKYKIIKKLKGITSLF